MPRFSALFFLIFATVACAIAQQQAAPPRPQTARQALIEMTAGGEQALAKHLTVEVQESMKHPGSKKGAASPGLAVLSGLRSFQTSGADTFETGPVLLSMTDAKAHEKFEVHVDSDDLSGDQDRLQLSLHAFRDGQEIDSPLQFISRIEVGMKKQENIWRLDEITVSATIPLGDPTLMAKLGAATAGGGMIGGKITGVPAGPDEQRLKLDAANTLRMLAFAEGTYASLHPDVGFTCSLSDLTNDRNEMITGMGVDPAVGSGSLNGYRFTLSGCQGTPAGSFQIAAEPITPSAGAKAFCSDATHNVRVSEDGRAATCLLSGKPEWGNSTLMLKQSNR